MRCSSVLCLLGLLVSNGRAHYVFPHFIVNGTETGLFQYVRDVAGDPENAAYDVPGSVISKIRPQYDRHSSAMACGREAWKAAKTTETADVVAGSEVGFRIQHEFDNSDNGLNYIFHTGPAQAYLARAPNDDLAAFNGTDGDWFKITSITTYYNDTDPKDKYWQFITYGATSVNFTIPTRTPPGKYLLRLEHFMGGYTPPPHLDNDQFYVNCAHVNIIGGGGGVITPEYYAKFPGAYKDDDPAIDIDYKHLGSYVGPGPKIWTGLEREVHFRG